MSIVVGIDLSLTSTGLALTVDGELSFFTRVTSKGSKTDDLLMRHARLRAIASEVLVLTSGADLVAIEAPSLGQARQAGTHDRSGLWWMVVGSLMDVQMPIATVPPACRAKYATGKGNADKDLVLSSVVRRYGGTWQRTISKNDEADAVVLAAMGSRFLREPLEVSLPESHLKGMTGAAWPVLTPSP